MNNKLRVEYVSISVPQPWEHNPKLHNDFAIEESMRKFKITRPILLQKGTNRIIAGHGQYNAMRRLGMKEVPAIRFDMDDKLASAYSLIDNQTTLSVGWDDDLLKNILKNLEAELPDLDMNLFGFGETLESLLLEGIIEDRIPEPPKVPKSKPGEVYELGRHRLMCGDATNRDHLDRLMNGKKAKLAFTSPPYNMAGQMYERYDDDMKSEKYIEFNLKVVKNLQRHLNGFLFWNISYNKHSRWEFIEILYRIVKETGLRYLELIVWDKGHGLPITSKQMLTRQYEDVLLVGDDDTVSKELELYYVGSTDRKAWFNKRTQRGITNYWRIGTNKTQLEVHAACFPVALPARGINVTTQPGDVVIDPFGGSGTTLIACEQLKRICYMMELDPAYCDVVRQRYENLARRLL